MKKSVRHKIIPPKHNDGVKKTNIRRKEQQNTNGNIFGFLLGSLFYVWLNIYK